MIIGKWVSKKSFAGTVTIVFYKNNNGYALCDSCQKVIKFNYETSRKGILKMRGSYGSDLYFIKLLTLNKLSLRGYPYKKYRESISMFNTDFFKQ